MRKIRGTATPLPEKPWQHTENPAFSEPTHYHAMAMFCNVTNSFPSSSLAVILPCCHSRFHGTHCILEMHTDVRF